MLWKTMNSTGTAKSKAIVPTSMPPTVPTPSEISPFAPAPVATTRGNRPIIIVRAVIRMGRRRAPAAESAACAMVMPFRRRSDAYSVSRMAVLASSPISMISPVCMYTLFSTPNIRANRKLPNSPNGMESITANGTNRLSYKAQRII